MPGATDRSKYKRDYREEVKAAQRCVTLSTTKAQAHKWEKRSKENSKATEELAEHRSAHRKQKTQ